MRHEKLHLIAGEVVGEINVGDERDVGSGKNASGGRVDVAEKRNVHAAGAIGLVFFYGGDGEGRFFAGRLLASGRSSDEPQICRTKIGIAKAANRAALESCFSFSRG